MVVGSDREGEIKKMEDINEDAAEGQDGTRWGEGEKPRKGWGHFLQHLRRCPVWLHPSMNIR